MTVPAGSKPLPATGMLLDIINVGRRHGFFDDELLAGTGLHTYDLPNASETIQVAAEFAVVRSLLRLSRERVGPGPVALGVEVGLGTHLASLSDLGAWRTAISSSATLGQGILTGLSFMSLTRTLTLITPEVVGRDVHLSVRNVVAPGELRIFYVVRAAAAMAVIGRQLTGVPVPLQEVCVDFPRSADAAVLESLAGIPIRWDAGQFRIVIAGEVLARPLPTRNERLHRETVEECRRQVDLLAAGPSWTTRVRGLLADGRAPGLDAAAAVLSVSARSLRRYLADEGTSFRSLQDEQRLDDVRRAFRAGLTHAQIARSLGYADVTGFSRAFRRWTGMPPEAWRRQNALDPD
ncbi:AraC family transcriptional regulator ligand-binding domain-containing protein [Spongisporangium articulatum]|uniref:AraC family transcriptional regulator ligand-binding domain-containing protein n=1 Tax=Spongisporangium articulatum TaxID=3362603 RepID=A0ABW8ATC4_9ACTN